MSELFIITNQMWGQIAKPLRNYAEGGYLHRLLFVVIAVAVIVYLETGRHVASYLPVAEITDVNHSRLIGWI